MPSSPSSTPGPEPSPGERLRRLRVLWDEHRRSPLPLLPEGDPHAQELVLYASWIGSLVEAALSTGGRLDPGQRRMLEVRRAEGNRAIWAAAAALGGAARPAAARLMALEDLLADVGANS